MKKLLVQTLTLVCFTITTVHALEREELGATLYQDSLFAILYRDATPDNRLYWVVYDSEGEQIQERVLRRYDALYTLSYYESNGTRALLVSKEQPDPSPILNSAILLGDDLFPKDTIELPLGEIVEIVPHTTGIVSVTKEPKTIAHGYAAYFFYINFSTPSNYDAWGTRITTSRYKPTISLSNDKMLVIGQYLGNPENITPPIFVLHDLHTAEVVWKRTFETGDSYRINDAFYKNKMWFATGSFDYVYNGRYSGTSSMGILTIDSLGEKLSIKTFDAPVIGMTYANKLRFFRDGTLAAVGRLGYNNNPGGIYGTAGLFNIPESYTSMEATPFGTPEENEEAMDIVLLGDDTRWVKMSNSGWHHFDHEFNLIASLTTTTPTPIAAPHISRKTAALQFVTGQTLRIELPPSTEEAVLNIYSVLGRKIKSMQLSTTSQHIDLQWLGKGTYISQLAYGNKVEAIKFSLQ